MGRCNICGSAETILVDINGCFGYGAKYYDGMHFSFELCQDHYKELKGMALDDREYNAPGQYTVQNGLKYDSKAIEQMVTQCKWVPNNYFLYNWYIYTYEEEQLMWETGKQILELVNYERFLDFINLFEEETVNQYYSERFPREYIAYSNQKELNKTSKKNPISTKSFCVIERETGKQIHNSNAQSLSSFFAMYDTPDFIIYGR